MKEHQEEKEEAKEEVKEEEGEEKLEWEGWYLEWQRCQAGPLPCKLPLPPKPTPVEALTP